MSAGKFKLFELPMRSAMRTQPCVPAWCDSVDGAVSWYVSSPHHYHPNLPLFHYSHLALTTHLPTMMYRDKQ